jgi:hypothetical protein
MPARFAWFVTIGMRISFVLLMEPQIHADERG